MFVRWQHRRRRARGVAPSTVHWAAVLVQAARVRGRPVQRHLAYLGGTTEEDAKDVGRRVQFWEKASEELDALGDQLSTEERRKIESGLASWVQRPTARERREQQRQRQQQREQQREQQHETLQRILELETELEAERERLLDYQENVERGP